MARRFPAMMLVLAGCAALASASVCAEHLYITTEHSPPSSMLQNGEVVGSATEKVRELLARAGIDYTIDLLPWKRAYALAQQRADTCVYSTTRTPERESLFKWVGPTDEGEWVLFGRAGRDYKLSALADARPLLIGTYSGDARDEYLRTRGFRVEPVQDDVSNPRKLLIGRVDLWAVAVRKGNAALVQSDWSNEIVPVLTFNRVKVYLACNLKLPDATIARMNLALASMQKDGSTRRIEQKYDRKTEEKVTGKSVPP